MLTIHNLLCKYDFNKGMCLRGAKIFLLNKQWHGGHMWNKEGLILYQTLMQRRQGGSDPISDPHAKKTLMIHLM